MPIARIRLGRSDDLAVAVYDETTAEFGVPLVELAGALEHLWHLWRLTPAQADELAAALTLAARRARGETMPITELDRFLARPAQS
jgi:hypothetical protein